MHRSLAAMLGAALAAAMAFVPGERVAAMGPDDGVALGPLPAEELQELLLEALPPPPPVVVRTTRYYGTVTIDHVAHLARRSPCKSCHGPGPVRKLEFTPKIAHERCIGCHQTIAKGPTSCQGCHVQPKPPPTELAAAMEKKPPPGPNAAHVAGAIEAFDAPRPVGWREPFHRTLDLGFTAGHGQGLSVQLSSNQNWIVLTQSVERVASGSEARTMGLMGAGLAKPLAGPVIFEGVALAGFDLVERPLLSLLPAIGFRAGLGWRTKRPLLRDVSASVTGLLDLTSHRAGNTRVGGATVFATVSTGFALKPQR
jgi:hypothetical protein